MSERDPPPPGNRTVLRPNPGNRRPTPSSPAPPPAEGWDAGPTAPSWSQPSPSPLFSGPPTGAAAGQAPVPKPLPREAWAAGPAPAAPAPVARRGVERIEELFAPNDDPLMRAAAPLLLLLGRLRASLLAANLLALRDRVKEAVERFDADIRASGIPEDQAQIAKYVVCATADDIVQNMPADDRRDWPRHSMLSIFFGEGLGGVRFFDLVEHAKKDPVVHYSLLELQHACLALGFQGRYRSEGGGAATLQQIQRSIYETLRRVRPRVARELSPRWKGQALGARRSRLHVPVWSVAAVTGLALFGLYVVLRYLLSGGAEVASAATLALGPPGQITIARKIVAPPPPPPPPTVTQLTQLQRIRAALAPEIGAGTISVPDPTGPQWIVINVGSLLLFRPGEAVVIEKFKPLADRIRTMLEKETGVIGVIGHTDTTQLSPTSAFKSNFDLSVARATTVVAILKQGFPNPERFRLRGKGADQPIADNKTEAGRRQNRRVEILVERTD